MTKIYWPVGFGNDPKPDRDAPCKISWWEWALATFLIVWGCKPTLREMLPFFAVSAVAVLLLMILFG